MRRLAAILTLTFAATLPAAEPVKSGIPEGEKLPKPFFPLNLNGDNAGEEDCPVCRFGNRPSAFVFTRQTGPAVLALARGLEKAAVARSADEFRACVVVLTDDKDAPKKLAQMAREEGLKHVLVATHAAEGPEDYGVNTDADVTALLTVGRVVKTNLARRKGEFTEADATKLTEAFGKLEKPAAPK